MNYTRRLLFPFQKWLILRKGSVLNFKFPNFQISRPRPRQLSLVRANFFLLPPRKVARHESSRTRSHRTRCCLSPNPRGAISLCGTHTETARCRGKRIRCRTVWRAWSGAVSWSSECSKLRMMLWACCGQLEQISNLDASERENLLLCLNLCACARVSPTRRHDDVRH